MLFMEAAGTDAVPFSDDVLTVTGLPANTLEGWLREHKHLFQ